MSAPLSAAIFPRKHARHAKPSQVGPVLVAGGLATAFAVTDGALLATSASAGGSQAQFERLAQCESGGRWNINTGNGYYGGLQFNLATWRGVGMGGYPHQASKATQIAAGQKLHSSRGWKPWPACSRKLGLSGDGGNSGSGGATAAKAPAKAPAKAAAKTSTDRRAAASRAASRSRGSVAAPRFDGHVMTVADRSGFRAATRDWQRQMRARGWKITVDGYFGPQSAGVAKRFAAEKGIRSARPGTVDKNVFTAAWTARVT
jgi:hypothetical protein